MTKLRCLALDDEPFALEMLADDISRVPFLELRGQFTDALLAWEQLRQEPVDLLFLDIQMPTVTGIQFLQRLPQPPLVIFTTAYEQYALQGYDLGVVDYLLKPVPFERFQKAAQKAYDLFQLRQQATQPAPRTFFFIFSEYKEIKIYHDEVLYVEGLKDYVKIYTTQQPRPYLSRLTLKTLSEKLPAAEFSRVHKSFVVALQQISSVQKARLFIGKQEIPIGSSYQAEFEQQYKEAGE